MSKMSILIKFFLPFFFASSLSTAANLKLDPKASKVEFSIYKFKIGAEVPGRFDRFQGTLEFDEKTSLLKKGFGRIEATSIWTDSEKRDAHLRSQDFFDVEKHPDIEFELMSHVGKPEAGTVKGKLTIKGVTKPVELQAKVLKSDPKSYELDLRGKLNRKDFNIVWNQVLDKGGFVLADEVNLKLLINAKP